MEVEVIRPFRQVGPALTTILRNFRAKFCLFVQTDEGNPRKHRIFQPESNVSIFFANVAFSLALPLFAQPLQWFLNKISFYNLKTIFVYLYPFNYDNKQYFVNKNILVFRISNDIC